MTFTPCVILFHHPGPYGDPEVLITHEGVRIGGTWFKPEKFDQAKNRPGPLWPQIWPAGASTGLNGERIEHFTLGMSYAPRHVRRVKTPSEIWWDIPTLENA